MPQGLKGCQHEVDLGVDEVDEVAGVAAGVVAIAHMAVVVEQLALEFAQQLAAQVGVIAQGEKGDEAFDDEGRSDDEQYRQG
ncbi:hypothetical protein [Magnetovirga frankeli]|uniref:hypothetical protein n=1 Tax=Magnetovirga frankeli TaxID=947516 RepID=UPI003D33CD79